MRPVPGVRAIIAISHLPDHTVATTLTTPFSDSQLGHVVTESERTSV